MPRASSLKKSLKENLNMVSFEDLLAPITLAPFRLVAVTSEDQAYELFDIAEWIIKTGHDPITRNPVKHLIIDAELQALIEKWFEQHNNEEKAQAEKGFGRPECYHPLKALIKLSQKKPPSFLMLAFKSGMLSLHTACTAWLTCGFLIQQGYICNMPLKHTLTGTFLIDFVPRLFLRSQTRFFSNEAKLIKTIREGENTIVPISSLHLEANSDNPINLLRLFEYPLYYLLFTCLVSSLLDLEKDEKTLLKLKLTLPSLLIGMIVGRIDYNIRSNNNSNQGLFFHPKRIARNVINELQNKACDAKEYFFPSVAPHHNS